MALFPMPSNVFATTGTNVSVIFFDKSASSDKVILIDASKLGEEYKEGNNQKRRLRDFEIDKIVNTFQNKETVDDFSVSVTYDEIKEKGYSLSAGQYFDIKIDYVDITEEEFNKRMSNYKSTLVQQFEESHRLEKEILEQLGTLASIVKLEKNNIMNETTKQNNGLLPNGYDLWRKDIEALIDTAKLHTKYNHIININFIYVTIC